MSLFELLVAMTLGALLLSAISTLFVLTKRQSIAQTNESTQLLEIMWVENWLRNSIHHADFTPCASLNRLLYQDRRSLKPRDSSGLSLRHMAKNYQLVNHMLSPNQLLIEKQSSLSAGMPVLIADCYHAETVFIQTLSKQAKGVLLTLKNRLNFNYEPPIYVGELMEERFFVRQNKRLKAALYCEGRRIEEVSEEISGIQVTEESGMVTVNLGLKNGSHRTILVDKRTK